MLPLIAIALIFFILLSAFLIGAHVGKMVPDEIMPGRKHLAMGIDVLFLLAIAVALIEFGRIFVAAAAIALFLAARRFFPFDYAHAPVSGIVAGAALFLPAAQASAVLVIVLVQNFLLGATISKKLLARTALLQPLATAVLLVVLSFV